MKITNKNIFELDQIIGRYVGAVQPNTLPEVREVRKQVLERVRKFTKFSFGLARNLSVIRPIITAVQLVAKNEKMEAYDAEMVAIARSKDTTPEEKEALFAEVREKYDIEKLREEDAAHQAEILEMEAVNDDGTPVKFFRIPVTQLPGWNDPDDCAEEKRMGAVTPTDLSILLDLGVLYDPGEAVEEQPVKSRPTPIGKKKNKTRR